MQLLSQERTNSTAMYGNSSEMTSWMLLTILSGRKILRANSKRGRASSARTSMDLRSAAQLLFPMYLTATTKYFSSAIMRDCDGVREKFKPARYLQLPREIAVSAIYRI